MMDDATARRGEILSDAIAEAVRIGSEMSLRSAASAFEKYPDLIFRDDVISALVRWADNGGVAAHLKERAQALREPDASNE